MVDRSPLPVKAVAGFCSNYYLIKDVVFIYNHRLLLTELQINSNSAV